MSYDPAFYDQIRSGCQASADAVVPWLLDLLADGGLPIHTVLDVGCGEGWWGAACKRRGVEHVAGIDGSPTDAGERLDQFVVADLEAVDLADHVPSAVDLAICVEVAEHLRDTTGLFDLLAHARVVLFSGAIPGQGGVGHVNCRWQTEWAGELADRGFVTSALPSAVWWEGVQVEAWYRQNMILAVRGDDLGTWRDGTGPQLRAALARCPVRDVVHPTIWGWK